MCSLILPSHHTTQNGFLILPGLRPAVLCMTSVTSIILRLRPPVNYLKLSTSHMYMYAKVHVRTSGSCSRTVNCIPLVKMFCHPVSWLSYIVN